MSAPQALEFATELADRFNAFEAETMRHSVDLRSCCCKEQLVITDGERSYEVTPVNDSSQPTDYAQWKWAVREVPN